MTISKLIALFTHTNKYVPLDFMKKSERNKLVEQQTTKIQGKVNEMNVVKSNGLKVTL